MSMTLNDRLEPFMQASMTSALPSWLIKGVCRIVRTSIPLSDHPKVNIPHGLSRLVLVFGGVRGRKVVAVTAACEVSSDATDGALRLVWVMLDRMREQRCTSSPLLTLIVRRR